MSLITGRGPLSGAPAGWFSPTRSAACPINRFRRHPDSLPESLPIKGFLSFDASADVVAELPESQVFGGE
jgi:hypothetical protein